MNNKKIVTILKHTILIIISLIYLIPFYIVIITALKKTNALATASPFVWFPKFSDLSFLAFKNVFTTYTIFKTGDSMILTGFKNTIIILVPVIIFGMFSSSIAAYAYAKLKFKLKKIFFAILMFSMMLPGIILLIPSYFMYDNLGLVDTFFPLIVPACFGSATCVFFLRQYYNSIPDELIEAAKIDGLGYFSIYLRIILPLAKPAILAQALLGIVACYNDYLNPLIYLLSEDKYTLQIALSMFSTGNSTSLPTIMAGALLAMLPMIIIYLFFQKYFINGLTMSGMKD